MQQGLGNKIRLSFFDASDGPRIMLFGPKDVDISLLQEAFRHLSKKCGELQLDEQQFVVPFGAIRVLLKCSGSIVDRNRKGKQQGIYRRSSDTVEFEWTKSAEGWDYLAELLNGLVKSDKAAHQYLSRYPDEDAIVVVSKGEYSDEVLSA